MLDSFKVEKKTAKSAYPPLPKDIYQVELLDITPQKRATYDTRALPVDQQEMETVFNFQFTVLDHRELRGRNIWANFIPVFLYNSKKNGKNKLYKIVEAFVGHSLTTDEEANLDHTVLNGFIGKQIRLSVEPVTKADKTFDNVCDFLPAYDLMNSLTDAEKEKAKIKPKTDNPAVPQF